jgi:hypothetical protein
MPLALDMLYHKTVALMNDSAANLITVEKAKIKFASLQHQMKSKAIAMMEEMIAEEQRLLHRATLEDERENNIVAAITDEIYDDVFAATPELKTTAKGKKRYVTPILKYRKERLEAHFLTAESHFIDKIIAHFKKQLEEKMTGSLTSILSG